MNGEWSSRRTSLDVFHCYDSLSFLHQTLGSSSCHRPTMLVFRLLRPSSGRRWFHSTATPAPTPAAAATVGAAVKNPFLGFYSRRSYFRFSSSAFCVPNKQIDLNRLYTLKPCCFSSHAAVDHQVGGIVDIPLAQTGEGIAECELLKCFVQEGDLVEEFQPLCEVQSDKATIEITSRYKGKVAQILCNPGDMVKVGETLLKMAVEEFPLPVSSGGLADAESSGPALGDSTSQESMLQENRFGGVLSTPGVRKLAKQYGIEINDVQGSGKDGRVLKEDVLKYAASKGIYEEPLTSFGTGSVHKSLEREEISHGSVAASLQYEDKTVPLRGFQRAMVKTMTMAAKIPHFHYVEELNCKALVELKTSFQNENSDPSIKHTFLPFLVKSLSLALSKQPLLNSCFNEEMQEIIVKGAHNIGIAMATPYGLVVPNIKKVQSLSILEITKELSRLQQQAIENKLASDDISGGTITLSNIGAIGGKIGSPLINVPEVAIIALGRIHSVPCFGDDGNVYASSVMNINIGADHRVLDGATVARFCNEWKLLVEKPELLLLHLK